MYIKGLTFNEKKLTDYASAIESIKYLKHELHSLTFSAPVVLFTGENGSGKSTLIEAIAYSLGLNLEGGTNNFRFYTKNTHSNLGESLRLIRSGELPKTSFFLRSESYYNLATEIEELMISHHYGERKLHALSHGQGMLSIIQHRFTDHGCYLLDEPESGLSVSRQLTLAAEIIQLVKQGSQFFISTHSPVLLALPRSEIFSLDQKIEKISYDQTSAYQEMKLFMDNPDRMMYLLQD